LDIQSWGVGNIPHNAHRWIKKDEDLQTFIHHPMCACGKCEDGMRWLVLGMKIQQKNLKQKINATIDKMPSCPPNLFLFGLGFFKIPMLIVGCCYNLYSLRPIKKVHGNWNLSPTRALLYLYPLACEKCGSYVRLNAWDGGCEILWF
jgi:hypothetical protein